MLATVIYRVLAKILRLTPMVITVYNFTVGDGISIPCSYTSHVVPISAPKLHADLSNTDAKLKVCIHS